MNEPPDIPKPLTQDEERDKLYSDWQADPTPERSQALLKSYDPIIQSQLGRFGDAMAMPALRAKAKKHALEAFKTYDPSKGAALGTHLVNRMNRLYRDSYESSQAMRMSEELQSGVTTYTQAKDELTAQLGREPTVAELQDSLGWPKSRITRTEEQLRGEATTSAFEFDPATIETDETDARIDYVYHDLAPRDQLIFEHVTGYGGKPIMSKTEIAKKLKISPAAVSQRSAAIAKRLTEGAGLA